MAPVSSLTEPRVLALAQPVSAPRGSGAGAPRFAVGGGERSTAGGDVIDVEVLWEEGDEGQRVSTSYGRRVGGTPIAPLRLTSPSVALAAYRSAASTREQPHQRIDRFA